MARQWDAARRQELVARAKSLLAAGDYAQAESLLRRTLAAKHRDSSLLAALGSVLHAAGKVEQAEYFLRQATALDPGSPEALGVLGRVLSGIGKSEEAESVLRRAIQADPRSSDARVSLGGLLRAQYRQFEAAQVLREGIEAGASEASLLNGYARALHAMGRIEEALPFLREVADAMPQFLPAASALCAAMNYAPGVLPGEVFAAHERYGRLLEAVSGVCPRPSGAGEERGPGRPLRVGFVSSDLRAHAVSYFIEPVLQCRDRERVHVTCYHVGPVEDSTSERLRAASDVWRSVRFAGFAELAEIIRKDQIDLLVELNGHMHGHRLQTMALRPAPVLATYLGYPNTTGVRAIDFRFVDSITDPIGSESLAVERLIRLDPFLCYRPSDDCPPVVSRPKGRGVVFGSFASLQKVNRPLLSLWASIVQACPGSRLVLKHPSLAEKATREDLAARLMECGLQEAQFEVRAPAKSVRNHLGVYGDVDITLDTHPYNGTTTIFESLVMGVPVVTLAGRAHAGRVTESILQNIGLADLVGKDEDGYILAALELARNSDRREQLRGSLRDLLLSSCLCDGRAHASRFCDALFSAWTGPLFG